MTSRLSRKRVMSMEDVIAEYIREMKIASGLNEQRISEAWDTVSGASAYTVSKYVRNNVLYCTISSSVVRNKLFFRKEEIMKEINDFLVADSLFVKDDPKTGLLKGIILK